MSTLNQLFSQTNEKLMHLCQKNKNDYEDHQEKNEYFPLLVQTEEEQPTFLLNDAAKDVYFKAFIDYPNYENILVVRIYCFRYEKYKSVFTEKKKKMKVNPSARQLEFYKKCLREMIHFFEKYAKQNEKSGIIYYYYNDDISKRLLKLFKNEISQFKGDVEKSLSLLMKNVGYHYSEDIEILGGCIFKKTIFEKIEAVQKTCHIISNTLKEEPHFVSTENKFKTEYLFKLFDGSRRFSYAGSNFQIKLNNEKNEMILQSTLVDDSFEERIPIESSALKGVLSRIYENNKLKNLLYKPRKNFNEFLSYFREVSWKNYEEIFNDQEETFGDWELVEVFFSKLCDKIHQKQYMLYFHLTEERNKRKAKAFKFDDVDGDSLIAILLIDKNDVDNPIYKLRVFKFNENFEWQSQVFHWLTENK